jgi:predicted nucleic-acid-binding protein
MSVTEHFIDTNLFLRYLTKDVPEQAQAVDRLLAEAERGRCRLRTSILTIAEIVWTLESYYELHKAEIRDRVMGMLNTPGLEVENSNLIARAIALYVDENIDFVDAYNGLWMQDIGISSVLTFDVRHYRRIPDLEAKTPGEVI